MAKKEYTNEQGQKVYTSRLKCTNCGQEDHLDIPVGTVIKEMDCRNCGCKTLELLPD